MLSGLRLSTICEIRKPFKYIPTGSVNLDELLGGGLRTAALTEILGQSGSGKTQVSIQLMLNTIFGPIDGKVIYVSTKNCLSPDDIRTRIGRYVDKYKKDNFKSENQPRTIESILKRIQHKRIYQLNELIFIVYHIREIVDRYSCYDPIKLVVIDSFDYFLRDQSLAERLRISYELAGVLENTAVKFNCAVLITTGMTAYPLQDLVDDEEEDENIEIMPLLGEAFAHRPNQRIELQRNPQNNTNITIAVVLKNLNGRCGAVKYQVDEEKGIIDVE